MSQCIGITKENKQCSRKANIGSEFCTQHSTEPKSAEPKPKKVELNVEFDFDRLKDDVLNVNETTNMIVLMKSVINLVKYIESVNTKFNFTKYLTVAEYKSLKKSLQEVICNERRIYLLIDYAFLNGYRSLEEPFSFYGVNPLTEEEKKLFYTFMPRGYTGTIPKRPNFSSVPKSSSVPPKKEEKKKESSVPPKKEEPKKETSAKITPEKLADIIKEIKVIMPDKNAATYIKLIMTSTNDLKYTRKEVMDLFREFHPDKAGTDPKAVQLCTLVSTKISLLKKKLDSSSSPTRPIGSLILDVYKILNQ